jgi:hypothetical protein
MTSIQESQKNDVNDIEAYKLALATCEATRDNFRQQWDFAAKDRDAALVRAQAAEARIRELTLYNEAGEKAAELAEEERDRLRVALKDALARAEAAEQERGHARDELAEATQNNDLVLVAFNDIAQAVGRPRQSRDTWDEFVAATIKAVTERQQATPCAGAHCIPNDEHQRVVNEVAALTDRLRTQTDGLNKHWQEQVRLAKADGHRRVRGLAAMLHAHVNAVAGEGP